MATNLEIQIMINALAGKTEAGSISPTDVAAILTEINSNNEPIKKAFINISTPPNQVNPIISNDTIGLVLGVPASKKSTGVYMLPITNNFNGKKIFINSMQRNVGDFKLCMVEYIQYAGGDPSRFEFRVFDLNGNLVDGIDQFTFKVEVY